MIVFHFFCTQAFEDHVKWCEEKARRLQDAPKKDHEALAKLNLRITYKPKTPVLTRKNSTTSTSSPNDLDDEKRKESFESTQSDKPMISDLKQKREVFK